VCFDRRSAKIPGCGIGVAPDRTDALSGAVRPACRHRASLRDDRNRSTGCRRTALGKRRTGTGDPVENKGRTASASIMTKVMPSHASLSTLQHLLRQDRQCRGKAHPSRRTPVVSAGAGRRVRRLFGDRRMRHRCRRDTVDKYLTWGEPAAKSPKRIRPR